MRKTNILQILTFKHHIVINSAVTFFNTLDFQI